MRIVFSKFIKIISLRFISSFIIILVYSILFEGYKILPVGSIFLILNLYLTKNINTKVFYFFYTICLLCLLYVAIGLFFILFFLINDFIILNNITLLSNLYIYFILSLVIFIYIRSSIYITLKSFHWFKNKENKGVR
jgi:hypothetical protein